MRMLRVRLLQALIVLVCCLGDVGREVLAALLEENGLSNKTTGSYDHAVKVFHFLIAHWGQSHHGSIPCGKTYCEWVVSDHIKHLRDNLRTFTPHIIHGAPVTTLSMYNIHSWWEKVRDTKPAICELKTNLTMAETEESFVRYSGLFDQSFKNFDGFSSTHPKSAVQRIYKDAIFNSSDLVPVQKFSSLIKGASYVASDCHRRDSANARRDEVVGHIRNLGFRVDGLGRCMHSEGPEGVALPKSRDTRYNLDLKRSTIGRFLFNMAFENSIESGYVTEKPFDALLAGTVPVYLGDANHLKSLIPHPKSVIFVADFANLTTLVQYLNYLTHNETAYEEHRAWRKEFSYERYIKNKPLMETNWFCRVCQWAVTAGHKHHKRTRLCLPNPQDDAADSNALPAIHSYLKQKLPVEWEGVALRASTQRAIYLVKDGVLRMIPDMDTFNTLKLDLAKVKVIEPINMEYMIVGEPMPKMDG